MSGRPWLRWAATAALFLALGLVTSVGVAWGIAVLSQHGQSHIASDVRKRAERWPGVHVDYGFRVERDGIRTWARSFSFIDFDPAPQWDPPGWSRLSEPPRDDVVRIYEFAAGWPWPCVRMVQEETMRDFWLITKIPHGSIEGLLPEHLIPGSGNPVAHLPAQLLALNLMFDVAIWAMAFLCIPWIPVVIRRVSWHMRRRRGRCGRCGYDLKGTSCGRCSECGAAINEVPGVLVIPSLKVDCGALIVFVVLVLSFLVTYRALGSGRALHWAAHDGDVERLQRLLDGGIEPDSTYEWGYGETPLMVACSRGHVEVVRRLLDGGADFNAADQNVGLTPLHRAAYGGHHDMVGLLCGRGADIEALTRIGDPPIHFAAYSGNVATVKALVDRGARLDVLNTLGRDAMQHGAQSGGGEIVSLLWERGAECDRRDNGGTSPLWEAIQREHFTVAEFLLDRGARIDDLRSYGENLWFLADHVLKSERLTAALLESGLDVNEADDNGRTALMAVAANGSPSTVEFLIQHGADVLATDGYGQTVLSFARDENRELIRAAAEHQRKEPGNRGGGD